MSESSTYRNGTVWTSLHSLSDEELLVRLVAGEHDPLAVLYDRYHRLIYSIAVRIVRDEAEAEDVVQTVFLNIFEAAANFDPLKGTLKVWMLQYAYHRSLNRRRMLSAQGIYRWDELDGMNEGSHMPDIGVSLLCQQILTQLKPIQRQVIELTYLEGLTAQEIAVQQQRSVTNVRHDLYRGMEKLRGVLVAPVKKEPRMEQLRERKNHIVGARTV
jgi:RNA polymerase sigma-70 factor (ECF subfamily)